MRVVRSAGRRAVQPPGPLFASDVFVVLVVLARFCGSCIESRLFDGRQFAPSAI